VIGQCHQILCHSSAIRNLDGWLMVQLTKTLSNSRLLYVILYIWASNFMTFLEGVLFSSTGSLQNLWKIKYAIWMVPT